MQLFTTNISNPNRCGVFCLTLVLGCVSCTANVESPSPAKSDTHIGADFYARQVEYLDSGLVAVPANNGVLISWRKFYSDADTSSFDIYRDGKKITSHGVVNKTNYLDAHGKVGATYELRAGSKILATAVAWTAPYLSVPITPPADGVTPDGQGYSYTANDASVGDLDGDGRYEVILKWDPTNAKDNSQGGFTGNVFIDAYTLDGKQLWRIDLGKNIRAGAHYTQFMVYDFDGDGRAEIAMKTADGTTDGQGKVIGNASANWVIARGELEVQDRSGSVVTTDGKYMGQLTGRILSGPEYFSVFEGSTGRVLDTAPYLPQRAPNNDNPTPDEMKAAWGDGYGNRSERYLAGVAYLDGQRPSAIMARGYYERTVIAAYDFRNGKISSRWVFDSSGTNVPPHFGGQGNHQLSVADIDADGKDEIIYGAMAIDDDGSAKWTTRLGHGDAMHVTDLDPAHEGLEKFGVHEDIRGNGGWGSALISVADGTVLWKKPAEKDTGRGIAADIDPRYLGAENWGWNSTELFNIKGETIAPVHPQQINFAVWWDGDLLRELLDGNSISKWDWNVNQTTSLLTAEGVSTNNGTKSNPALSADLFGDWREEVIWRADDNKSLRIYATNVPTEYGLPTLMHDTQYRVAIAWQNTAYNQPPHPGFYVGDKMDAPVKPKLDIVKRQK
ncbi:MAG: rhamnogalacturonan lyase [Cellvibrio sp.]|nr:rhamnogalacturonan lyase [Cellvibrio sp.]